MSIGLERDTVFVALTRPQMFAGVTYSVFVANAIIATELFLIFRSLWVIAAGKLLVEAAGGKVELEPAADHSDSWAIVATNGKIPIEEIL